MPLSIKQRRPLHLPHKDTESIFCKQGANHTEGKCLAFSVQASCTMTARQDTTIAVLLNSLQARNPALTTISSSSFRETGLKDWESLDFHHCDSTTTLDATHIQILRNMVKGRINIPGVLLQTPAIESS